MDVEIEMDLSKIIINHAAFHVTFIATFIRSVTYRSLSFVIAAKTDNLSEHLFDRVCAFSTQFSYILDTVTRYLYIIRANRSFT